MKKLFVLGAILLSSCLSNTSFAQDVTRFTMTSQKADGTVKAVTSPDTTSGQDTTYMVLTTNGDGSVLSNNDIAYYFTVTNLTGTTTGTVTMQGSESGTFAVVGDWLPLVTDKTQAALTDQYVVSGTTSGYFMLVSCKWKYVRLRFISPSGAQTSYMRTYAYLRRRA